MRGCASAAHLTDRRVLNLIGQYLRRCVEGGDLYWASTQGLALGCPLSPILGAFFLHELDVQLEHRGFCFVRYMDDIVVLTPTRWKLRCAVVLVNQVLAALGLQKHPGKTFIGRIAKGFTFLGYEVSPAGLRVARQTVARFVARACRLYEQPPGGRCALARLRAYVRRWVRWVNAGLPRGLWPGQGVGDIGRSVMDTKVRDALPGGQGAAGRCSGRAPGALLLLLSDLTRVDGMWQCKT